jgi:hypothetical protein
MRRHVSIAVTDLDRALRATLWPAVKAHGFSARTSRVAWRYAGDDVDVVELQMVGQNAEAVGCPSLSLSVYVATFPHFLPRDGRIPTRDGRLRPHYWNCDPFSQSLQKTIAQPWFQPFSEPCDNRVLPSIRLHRDALRKLVNQAVHDVPNIWYMRDDGANLDENLQDLTNVVLTAGMDLLDQWHDPELVLDLIESGRLLNAESPRAYYLSESIRDYLAASSRFTRDIPAH